jgi:hypothetical protein
MDDRAVVARQLGREPRAFRRVVVYCPHGMPAVTEQLRTTSRRAVSDHVLPHVLVSRHGARSHRSRGAWSDGVARPRMIQRSRRRSLPRRRISVGSGMSCGHRGRVRRRRSPRPGYRRCELAYASEVPPCACGVRARASGYVLGERVLTRSSRRGPSSGAARRFSRPDDILRAAT